MEQIKFKVEFSVDVKILKEVLEERKLESNIANMKKITGICKQRTYNVNKKFFDDIPKDIETLIMYGLKPIKQE